MDRLFAIFDMDGTLVESMHFWRNIGREYLERTHGQTVGDDPVLREIVSMTMLGASETLQRHFHLSETPGQVRDGFNALMAQHYRSDVRAKEGIRTYLEQLRRRGVRMCVVSNTDKPLVRDCLARLELLPYFDFLITCAEAGAGKDRPDVYLTAARRMGASAAETAVFEDALYALRTAKAAGFHTVAVYDGNAAEDWQTALRFADEYVKSWPEGPLQNGGKK